MKMERCTTVEELKRDEPNHKSSRCAEVIICVSDDEADVVDVTMEQMEAAVTDQRAEVSQCTVMAFVAAHADSDTEFYIRTCDCMLHHVYVVV